MKKGILAVIVVAVVIVGAVIGIKMMKTKTAEQMAGGPSGVEKSITEIAVPKGKVAIADIVPSDVIMFVSARDAKSTWNLIKTSNFWKKISALKVFSTVLQGVNLDNLSAQFQANLGFDLSEGTILGLFGQDLSLALVGSKEGINSPQLLLFAQADPKADIQGKVASLIEKVKANVTVETVEYNGQKITRIRNPQIPGPEFNYAFVSDVLVLGIGIDDSGVRKVVDLASKKSSDSLSSNAEYKNAIGVLKLRGDLKGIIYMSMARIIELVKSLPTPEGTPAGFTAGLEQTLGAIKAIVGAASFDRGLLVKLFFIKNTEVASPEIMAAWNASPRPAESLNFLPEGSLLLTVSNSLDLAKLWDSWQANLGTQNPEQAKIVMDALAAFEKDSGIVVKDQIISLLGDEICFAITNIDMSGLFPFPHVAILAKVKDEAKAQEVMKKILDYTILKSAPAGVSATTPATETTSTAVATEVTGTATPAEETAPVPQMTTAQEDYNGVKITSLEIQLPYQTLNPSYATVNGFLVIGVNKDSLKNIIDVVKGTKPSVAKGQEFKDVTVGFSPKTNQMAFLNFKRTIDIIVEITKWANNLQKGRGGEAAAQTDQLLQENILPLLESLKVIKAVAVEAVNQDKGIEETLYVQIEDLKE